MTREKPIGAIEYLEERLKEDKENITTEREQQEYNFKIVLLVQYKVSKDIASGEEDWQKYFGPEKFEKIAFRQHMVLHQLASIVYGYDKYLEEEWEKEPWNL